MSGERILATTGKPTLVFCAGLHDVQIRTVFKDLLPRDDPFVKLYLAHPNFGRELMNNSGMNPDDFFKKTSSPTDANSNLNLGFLLYETGDKAGADAGTPGQTASADAGSGVFPLPADGALQALAPAHGAAAWRLLAAPPWRNHISGPLERPPQA
mgnify:CR=1 FL=1